METAEAAYYWFLRNNNLEDSPESQEKFRQEVFKLVFGERPPL